PSKFLKEVLAALTSFFAAIYIIVVNASILSDAHIAMEPLIISTVFASFTGCMIAAFVTNAPLIITSQRKIDNTYGQNIFYKN
ncbi:Xanthine/uracil permease family protein, partial [human gut metagenome]